MSRQALLLDLLEGRPVGRAAPREPRRRAVRRAEQPREMDPASHYIAVRLGAKSRARLLRHVSPAHANVSAEHVTLIDRPTDKDIARFHPMSGNQVSFHATHSASDSELGVHAVRVRGLDHLSDKPHKHITISTRSETPSSAGVSTTKSNDLLATTKGDRLPNWVPLTGTIEVAERLGRT